MTKVAPGPWCEPLRAAAGDRLSGASAIAMRAADALTTLAEQAPAADVGVPPHIAEHSPGEICPDAPEGILVVNRYFDVTPWSALGGVVSEQGVLSGDGVVRLIQDMRVSGALLDIV